MATYFDTLSNWTHAFMNLFAGDWAVTGVAIFGGVFILVMVGLGVYCAFACKCKPVPGLRSTGLMSGPVLQNNPKCPMHGRDT